MLITFELMDLKKIFLFILLFITDKNKQMHMIVK